MIKIIGFLVLYLFSFANEGFYIQGIKLEYKTFEEMHQFYGTIMIKDSNIATITTRVDGYVEEIFAQNTFDLIQKGEKLFTLYSPELLAVQNEYINALKFNNNSNKIQKKLSLMGMDFKVLLQLKKYQSPQVIIPFFSQVHGYVFEKNITKGQFIKKGELLYRVVDLSSVWFVVKIPQVKREFLYSFIQNHKNYKQNAVLKIEGIAEEFNMIFEQVLPNVNDKFIEVRFSVSNTALKLIPKMFGVATLKNLTKKILIAPNHAILARNGKFYVFVKNADERFKPVEVVVHQLQNGDYEILSGVGAGVEIAKDSLFVLDADAQNNGDY